MTCQMLLRYCSQPLISLIHLPIPPSSNLSTTLVAMTTLLIHTSTSSLTIYHDETIRDTVNIMYVIINDQI